MRTSNPALNEKSFKGMPLVSSESMTVEGTVNKTLILTLLLFISAGFFWINVDKFIENNSLSLFMFGSIILGLIFAFITIFKKEWSPVTAPIYVVVEGVFLGLISVVLERIFPGIVLQAIALTVGTLLMLLLLYKSGIIKATENFKLGVFAATGGVLFIYVITFVLSFFGTTIPYIHGNGMIGIGFSFVVVIIAALNLVLDFDFIENATKNKVPKYMEWYGAFGLMVTLIWLYIEILRLLAKIRSR